MAEIIGIYLLLTSIYLFLIIDKSTSILLTQILQLIFFNYMINLICLIVYMLSEQVHYVKSDPP